MYAAALSPTGPATVAAPALYQAIPAAGNQALISGRLSANTSSDYEITIKTAATCDEGVLGEGGSTLGSFTTTTDDVGDSYFSSSCRTVPTWTRTSPQRSRDPAA